MSKFVLLREVIWPSRFDDDDVYDDAEYGSDDEYAPLPTPDDVSGLGVFLSNHISMVVVACLLCGVVVSMFATSAYKRWRLVMQRSSVGRLCGEVVVNASPSAGCIEGGGSYESPFTLPPSSSSPLLSTDDSSQVAANPQSSDEPFDEQHYHPSISPTPTPTPPPHDTHTKDERPSRCRMRTPVQQKKQKPTLFASRWYVLGVFVLVSVNQSQLGITFSPISEQAAEYYDVPRSTISLFTNWSFIMAVPALLPTMWLTSQKNGLRRAVVLGAVLEALCAALRLVPSMFPSSLLASAGGNKDLGLAFIHAAQILNGIAEPLTLVPPTLLSCTWFGEKERTLATAIAILGDDLGNIPAFLLGPVMVTTSAFGAEGDLKNYLVLQAAMASVALFLVLAYFPNEPPTPPYTIVAARETQVLRWGDVEAVLSSVPERRRVSAPVFSTGVRFYGSGGRGGEPGGGGKQRTLQSEGGSGVSFPSSFGRSFGYNSKSLPGHARQSTLTASMRRELAVPRSSRRGRSIGSRPTDGTDDESLFMNSIGGYEPDPKASFWESCQMAIRNRDLMLIAAAGGILTGTFVAWATVFENILPLDGFDAVEAGLLSTATTVTSIVGGLGIDSIAQRWFDRRWKALMLGLFPWCLLFVGLFTMSLHSSVWQGHAAILQWGEDDDVRADFWVLLMLVCLAGLFLGATFPFFYEMAVEVSYPHVPEAVSAGLISAWIYCVMTVFFWIENEFTDSLNLIMAGSVIAAGALVIPVREVYKRADAHAKIAAGGDTVQYMT